MHGESMVCPLTILKLHLVRPFIPFEHLIENHSYHLQKMNHKSEGKRSEAVVSNHKQTESLILVLTHRQSQVTRGSPTFIRQQIH